MTTRIGEVLDGVYELEALLGSDGTHEQYRALDRRTGAAVFVRLIHAELALQGHVVDAFLRRPRALARLRHDALPWIQIGSDETGIPFVLEEAVEGRPLSELIAGFPQGLPLALVHRLWVPVLEVVALAHHQGLTHGAIDTKHVQLLGAAHESMPKLVGFYEEAGEQDRHYRALEHRVEAGAANSPQADVFALGVMLYQMLSGELPFRSGQRGPIPIEEVAPDLPRSWLRLTAACLQASPVDGPCDASALLPLVPLPSRAPAVAGDSQRPQELTSSAPPAPSSDRVRRAVEPSATSADDVAASTQRTRPGRYSSRAPSRGKASGGQRAQRGPHPSAASADPAGLGAQRAQPGRYSSTASSRGAASNGQRGRRDAYPSAAPAEQATLSAQRGQPGQYSSRAPERSGASGQPTQPDRSAAEVASSARTRPGRHSSGAAQRGGPASGQQAQRGRQTSSAFAGTVSSRTTQPTQGQSLRSGARGALGAYVAGAARGQHASASPLAAAAEARPQELPQTSRPPVSVAYVGEGRTRDAGEPRAERGDESSVAPMRRDAPHGDAAPRGLVAAPGSSEPAYERDAAARERAQQTGASAPANDNAHLQSRRPAQPGASATPGAVTTRSKRPSARYGRSQTAPEPGALALSQQQLTAVLLLGERDEERERRRRLLFILFLFLLLWAAPVLYAPSVTGAQGLPGPKLRVVATAFSITATVAALQAWASRLGGRSLMHRLQAVLLSALAGCAVLTTAALYAEVPRMAAAVSGAARGLPWLVGFAFLLLALELGLHGARRLAHQAWLGVLALALCGLGLAGSYRALGRAMPGLRNPAVLAQPSAEQQRTSSASLRAEPRSAAELGSADTTERSPDAAAEPRAREQVGASEQEDLKPSQELMKRRTQQRSIYQRLKAKWSAWLSER